MSEREYDGKMKYDGRKDLRTVHKTETGEDGNKIPIVIHDIPFVIDDEGDELIDVDDAIRQYENGNWDYVKDED